MSVVVQGPLGRIVAFIRVSEEPRKGAKKKASDSVERAQGNEQIRNLFLDPLGVCGMFMCHAMKMWVYSLKEGVALRLRDRSKVVQTAEKRRPVGQEAQRGQIFNSSKASVYSFVNMEKRVINPHDHHKNEINKIIYVMWPGSYT